MFDGDDRSDEPGMEEYDESDHVDEQYQEPEEPDFDIEPDIPEPPSPEDADPELQAQFWALVVVFNIALIGVSLGAMFAVFENDYVFGGQLLLGGAVLFAYGFYRYRTITATLGDDQNE